MGTIKLFLIGYLTLAILFIVSCTKGTLPAVTTNEITNISTTAAQAGGTVTSTGDVDLQEAGVCWSTNQNPTISDFKTVDTSGQMTFSNKISGLEFRTKYFICAYAINEVGVAYGNELSFSTLDSVFFNNFMTYNTVSDYEENIYRTIKIGTQTWMAENLRATKFNNGAPIPLVTTNSEWAALLTPGYCWLNNDKEYYGSMYGALYNWYVTSNTSNICPIGWHVPFNSEWITLIDYLGGSTFAGARLKESGIFHWSDPNYATNSSGFTALPGGYREDTGTFDYTNAFSYWWTSTSADDDFSGYTYIPHNSETIYIGQSPRKSGYSIRCIKD